MSAVIHSPTGLSQRDELIMKLGRAAACVGGGEVLNAEQEAVVRRLGRMKLRERLRGASMQELRALSYSWGFFSRPAQRPPTVPYRVWLILGGRAFGKTLTGAQYVRAMVESGKYRSIALIAPHVADIRDTMIQGVSGILNAFPPHRRPDYVPSKRLLKFHNGAQAITYSADTPEALRGPNHDLAWIDEAAACRYLGDVWNWLTPAVRYGPAPKVLITTTPKPVKLLFDLVASDTTVLTTGSTYDNAHNLPASMIEAVESTYGDTELGEQELGGKLLGNAPGALFRQAWLDRHRVSTMPSKAEIKTTIVAVDPSSSESKEACEVGIIVAALTTSGAVLVLEDASGIMSPAAWISAVANLRKKYAASAIVYEANYGKGFIDELFRLLARDEVLYLKPVHAEVSKAARATPVCALVEKGTVKLVGVHRALETQLTTWIPGRGKSPDRLDALVHAVIHLVIGRVHPHKYAVLSA